MVTLPRLDINPYSIAKIWIAFTLTSLVLFVVFSKAAYFEFDALGIWILTSLAILYLSRKNMEFLTDRQCLWIGALGAGIIIFSFFSIPSGFTHPPYSIGEYSLFLSGLGLVIFGLLRSGRSCCRYPCRLSRLPDFQVMNYFSGTRNG